MTYPEFILRLKQGEAREEMGGQEGLVGPA